MLAGLRSGVRPGSASSISSSSSTPSSSTPSSSPTNSSPTSSSPTSSSTLGRSWDRRSVFVVCLLPCTRPSPLLRSHNQSSPNRILLHIPNQRSQFLLRPNPVIVGLILPKRKASATQNLIRHPRRAPLKPTHDRGVIAAKLPDDMHMVRHNHPSVRLVKIAVGFSIPKRVGNHLRNATICQPHRSVRLTRQRSGQPPCNGEYSVVRNPVRKVSVIKQHSDLVKRQTTENRWSVLRFALVVPAPVNSL
jgi:hypothetical protein